MTKKILAMFLLLALAIGLYAMSANAEGQGVAMVPTQTAQASQTAKPGACKVYTGIERGTVNLRSCEGTSCDVLDILTEGESLNVLTAGLWTKVTTKDGVTGWLNSNYCKKEK